VEKLVFALQITGLGLSVVFIAFILLYGVMVVYKHLFSRLIGAGEPNLQPQPRRESEALPPSVKISPHLVAAITAAVGCYQQPEEIHLATDKGLTTSLQASGGSRWADAGRKTLMDGKLRLENMRRK